jgi:hypothetical protein
MSLRSCTFLLLFLLPIVVPVRSSSQAIRPREHLRGVLSRAKLSPELRSAASIRYSPDGKYLLVQDSAGVMLLSTNPLKFVSYFDAAFSYSARFSADSQSLVLLTYDLFLTRWRLSDGTRMESPQLATPGGCLYAALSPGADLLACYAPDMSLDLYRLSNAKKVFSAPIHNLPVGSQHVAVPLESPTNFSAPFGYFLSSEITPLANRGLFRVPVWFSPDGNFLIAGDEYDSLRVNLNTFSKENFASPLHKHLNTIAGLAPKDRALILDSPNSGFPALVSFSTAQPVLKFSFSAEQAALCTNPRYAFFRNESDATFAIADLDLNALYPVSDGVSADAFDNTIAILKHDGLIAFFKAGEAKPFTVVRLPLGTLPPLRATAVDPELTTVSLSAPGVGITFDTASGRSLLTQKLFIGAKAADSKRQFFISPRNFKSPYEIVRGDLNARTAETAWNASLAAQILPSEGAFLEYSFWRDLDLLTHVRRDPSGIAFQLRGLDPATGSQLWDFKYDEDVPVPFSDPQGNRLVLGWKAKTYRANVAIRNSPAIREAYKKSKRMDQDSVFEVIDSITGKSLGGVFVQFGGGPINFSSAFSVGDYLFLVKDNLRVNVFSLRDGKIVAHAKGYQPAPNAQANLFALDEGMGRLGIYDLLTGQKIEEQLFGDNLAYKHFSLDGKKLLVLTQHQEVFVLDMSTVREHPLPPPHPVMQPSDDSADQPQ